MVRYAVRHHLAQGPCLARQQDDQTHRSRAGTGLPQPTRTFTRDTAAVNLTPAHHRTRALGLCQRSESGIGRRASTAASRVEGRPHATYAFRLSSLLPPPHGPACVMYSLPLPSSWHPLSADINRWPYTLGPTATLTRAFQLFRLMGLRHLIISTHRRRRRAQAQCFG
jgi:hypothetical protein